jgi:hypothetical protein
MPSPSKLTPLEVLDKQSVAWRNASTPCVASSWMGFKPVIAELSKEIHLLNRGRDYIENSAGTPRQELF